MGQIMVVNKTIEELNDKYNNLVIFMGGDFNSLPYSGMYNFVTGKTLDLTNVDRNKLSGQFLGFKKFNSVINWNKLKMNSTRIFAEKEIIKVFR